MGYYKITILFILSWKSISILVRSSLFFVSEDSEQEKLVEKLISLQTDALYFKKLWW